MNCIKVVSGCGVVIMDVQDMAGKQLRNVLIYKTINRDAEVCWQALELSSR